MKMKQGELVGFQGCLGYDYDVATNLFPLTKKVQRLSAIYLKGM